MKNYEFISKKSNLFVESNGNKISDELSIDIKLFEETSDCHLYKTLIFDDVHNAKKIKELLKRELLSFFRRASLSKKSHIFVVGIGNDRHTADSVGPETLKKVKVNAYLENFGIEFDGPKVSALEPGVVGETGIKTGRILKSVVDEIKPDYVILIDSFISCNINYLERCIELSDAGLSNDTGIRGFERNIDEDYLGVKVLTVGVPTAVELSFDTSANRHFYTLSSKNIDEYVRHISTIIGESLNEAIYELTGRPDSNGSISPRH